MSQVSQARTYVLRLPVSVKELSTVVAKAEGVSLNHFISLAVTEKLARMERAAQVKLMSRLPEMRQRHFG